MIGNAIPQGNKNRRSQASFNRVTSGHVCDFARSAFAIGTATAKPLGQCHFSAYKWNTEPAEKGVLERVMESVGSNSETRHRWVFTEWPRKMDQPRRTC